MSQQTLTFCRWYIKTAVYLGDDLIIHADVEPCQRLLETLGYKVRILENVPTEGNAEEHVWDKCGWWVPPVSLTVLEAQIRQRKVREVNAEIAQAERVLRSLKERWAMLEAKR